MTSINNNYSTLDTSLSHYIKLQIQYGSDLYELLLSSKDNKIQVEHVLNEIEKVIKIPKCHQTLIYKGQRLDHKPKENLEDLYIFNNSKLILNGTQKSSHDKCDCLNHNYNNSLSSQKQQNNKTNVKDKIVEDPNVKTQSSLLVPKKEEIYSNLIGFTPEPNKNYEYYTVPYKTDPTTLLQNIRLS